MRRSLQSHICSRHGATEDGIENIDVSGIVAGHLEYATQMPRLLHLVGLADQPPDTYALTPCHVHDPSHAYSNPMPCARPLPPLFQKRA